jgi:hypothetical protein
MSMSFEIAIVLLCPNNEHLTCEDDVWAIYRARAAATTDPDRLRKYELARDRLLKDVHSMCGKINSLRTEGASATSRGPGRPSQKRYFNDGLEAVKVPLDLARNSS